MVTGMMNQSVGAVSAGHPATAESAARILRDGGNAFDAVVAAHITACVAEPVLASFAGGGFLLAETGDGRQTLYDFFVQTPCAIKRKEELNFFPISADFGYALQEFNIGPGSVATPGTVKGLFNIHRDLCSMPFKKLAEHAIEFARNGNEMNSFQALAFDITQPIYFSNREAVEIFKSPGNHESLIREGEWLKQPLLADFIENLTREGESFFYDGEIAEKICKICDEQGGNLTQKDLNRYRVEKRAPLQVNYRNSSLMINPPPSTGGLLITFALKLMETFGQDSVKSKPDLLVHVQDLTNRARIEGIIKNRDQKRSEHLFHPPFVEIYRNEIKNRLHASRGTTQISVMDGEGNMASLTTSNGSGSGVMIPGTGVMMNNMLGEEDLNPAGFYSWPVNRRISSMMAPAVIRLSDGRKIVLGSGGSNRIRTAILQVILNVSDKKMSLKRAVQAPRIHFENDFLNIEPGFSEDVKKILAGNYPDHKIWKEQSLFFGGVHAVSSKEGRFSGVGDPRRGGVSMIV